MYPLVIFLGDGGKQVTVNVDYSVPVQELLPTIFQKVGLRTKKEGQFQLRQLSPDVSIHLNKSLHAQHIPVNATLLLRLLEKKETGNSSSTTKDVNLYEEETSEKTILVDKDGKIRAGTLNKLVEYMTSEMVVDLDYMKAFLLTYRSFTTPDQLYSKLIERYNMPQPENLSPEELENWKRNKLRPVQLRVCSAMKHWIESQPQDFTHELTQELVQFVDNLNTDFPGNQSLYKQMTEAILNRVRFHLDLLWS
jgi:hypothetical protein